MWPWCFFYFWIQLIVPSFSTLFSRPSWKRRCDTTEKKQKQRHVLEIFPHIPSNFHFLPCPFEMLRCINSMSKNLSQDDLIFFLMTYHDAKKRKLKRITGRKGNEKNRKQARKHTYLCPWSFGWHFSNSYNHTIGYRGHQPFCQKLMPALTAADKFATQHGYTLSIGLLTPSNVCKRSKQQVRTDWEGQSCVLNCVTKTQHD